MQQPCGLTPCHGSRKCSGSMKTRTSATAKRTPTKPRLKQDVVKRRVAVTAAKQRRGFAAMHPDKQRDIASLGGLVVSRNRKHMQAIGRRGGLRTQQVKRVL